MCYPLSEVLSCEPYPAFILLHFREAWNLAVNVKGKFHKCSLPSMCPGQPYPSLWGQAAPLPPAPLQQGWDTFVMSKWHRWRANHWVFSCLPRSLKAQRSSWWLRQSGNGLKRDASPLFPSSLPSCTGASCQGRHKMKAHNPGQQYKGGHIQISRGYLGRELPPSLHTVTQPASSSSCCWWMLQENPTDKTWCWIIDIKHQSHGSAHENCKPQHYHQNCNHSITTSWLLLCCWDLNLGNSVYSWIQVSLSSVQTLVHKEMIFMYLLFLSKFWSPWPEEQDFWKIQYSYKFHEN